MIPSARRSNLVHVAIAAWGETSDPDCEPDAIVTVIRMAQAKLKSWFDAHDSVDQNHASLYDAVDILALVEFALQSEIPPTTRCSISPMLGGMKVAAQILAEVVSSAEEEETQS